MDTELTQSSDHGLEIQYPQSWIDRLIYWIDRLPGPAWVPYLVAILALTLLISVTLWMDGSVPFGSYGSFQGILPPFVFFGLALYHYLTGVSSRSLLAFRPLLQADEAEIAQYKDELSRLPSWLGRIAIVLAVITLPPYFLGGQAFGDRNPNTVLPFIIAIPSAAFFSATLFALIIRSYRQLRMVAELQARAKTINLLELEPAHAFSGLTARTGSGLLLLLILGYLYNPSSFVGGWLIASYILTVIPAIVVFVVPVLGMRDRLMQERRHVLHETNKLLQLTSDRLESKIRNDDYNDLQGMETAIRTLIRKREMVEKISTWPWNSATVRGFTSTLLLPILLWLITRVLGRFV